MNFNEQEKMYQRLIENNLQFFNCARRKTLQVKYYVDEGNKARIEWGHVTIADGLTVQEAHFFVWGFTRGREGR